ncbi:pyridoxal phosphate-dependent aminotransferase family protein [Allomuricauda sp. d1]|uniref:aminotransferase class I/II-fold pyridoxal phosphate-dependent enzyme n=1 Tax=Allomuricauda sp. d1 TaxID=3136725 RepID=UPI0031E468D8
METKLQKRADEDALRKLSYDEGLVDFSSNDYLGFARNSEIENIALKQLSQMNHPKNGATGSRLLSGSYPLLGTLEESIAKFHEVEAALVFNSGYDANIGFFSSVPQRGNFIFYDELVHASIRDGIQMSHAKAYKFKHNDLEDLRCHIERISPTGRQGRNIDSSVEIYVITESVFSMDGDVPDLESLAIFCSEHGFRLVVDEAHATGIFGEGKGLINEFGLEKKVFARLVTFGKAMGCHGAAWLGSEKMKSYLINFARSFIYTTALPPHTAASILAAYEVLQKSIGKEKIDTLKSNIHFFVDTVKNLGLNTYFGLSDSAIQICFVDGNQKAKQLSKELKEEGFDVRPIFSPTVPKGKERLRFCLHAFNTEHEIKKVLNLVKGHLK